MKKQKYHGLRQASNKQLVVLAHLAYSLTLKVEAICFTETSVSFHRLHGVKSLFVRNPIRFK
jgi:hypothetical protein